MTTPASRWINLMLVMIAAPLPPSLFAQIKNQHAAIGVRVPFVGCPADGQAGPLEAPKGSDKVVQIDSNAARQLAYYQAGNSPGVLGPRGWHCFGAYGSNGGQLFVSPMSYTTADFFSKKWNGFDGPAIDVAITTAATSGRFSVAQVIARVFPAYRAFVQHVIDEEIEPASDFPFGPYPKDKLTYRGDRVVKYETPARTEGLGTTSWLRANNMDITGVEILMGNDDLDLLSGAVRLPHEMKDLAAPIIEQIEREHPVNSQK
jgi:hypothetical protein